MKDPFIEMQDRWCREIQEISDLYEISDSYAEAIWYLRTRSRYTSDLEKQLVEMAKKGEPIPDMNKWP